MTAVDPLIAGPFRGRRDVRVMGVIYSKVRPDERIC
jgi:hypothetical protein